MAEAAAVTFLLEQVAVVIKAHVGLISGAEEEFRNLEKDLKELKAILMDLANKSSEEAHAREIETQLRQLIYEVEDAIDSCLTAEDAGRSKNKFSRGLQRINPTHTGLTKEVKTLRQGKVKQMLEKANFMKSIQGAQAKTTDEQANDRRSDQPIRQERIVGLKDEEKKITGYLVADQKKLDVISIIGMPGLGKTTLAWKIFNDPNISHAFPIRIWVFFSERFSGKDVLLQILKHFISKSEDVSGQSPRELCKAVHACLNQEKFLLVFDDVWMTEHWNAIKDALPFSNGNGKVLITSREMEVGRYVRQITDPHELRFMNLEESWELLQLEVFGDTGICPDELQPMGEHIAQKCEGVPLTIVVIGGVLKDHYLSLKSVVLVNKKWEDMANNLKQGLNSKLQILNDVVELSYKRLPQHLRECFVYLGAFPAGHDIQTWTLKWLWIAEGFIQPDEHRTLEKIAEEYFNDLVSRNLLIVRKMNPIREVKRCRVHDLIRFFCTKKASEMCLYQEMNMSVPDVDLRSKMEKLHRLCIHSDLDKFFSGIVEGPRVRSFLCFRKDVIGLQPQYNSAISDHFKALRILQSMSVRFNQFPQGIIKLIHLRYIVLCVADLKVLPEPLSQLWNLQTVVVDTSSDSLEMKANIWEMVRLRHVKSKAALVLDKASKSKTKAKTKAKGKGKGKSEGEGEGGSVSRVGGEGGRSLQTLNRVSPESVTEAFCEKANNLKTLGIRGELTPLFKDFPLEGLNSLEKLKLYQAVTENKLQHFPGSDHFPPNLKRLTLSNTFLDWNVVMPILASLVYIEVLKLKENACTGFSWKADGSYKFQNLQFLLIFNSDLLLWDASPNTFPDLRHLVLRSCEKLKEIPKYVLDRLESLELERVRKSTADSARNSNVAKLSIGPGCDI